MATLNFAVSLAAETQGATLESSPLVNLSGTQEYSNVFNSLKNSKNNRSHLILILQFYVLG